MRRFLCIGSLSAFLLMFSPSLLADGVHSFTYRADSDFDNSHFADANSASVGAHHAFFESRSFGPNEERVNSLGDFDDDHSKAWGWRKGHHHHHSGDNGWNSGDQGNGDTDGDSGNAGSTGSTPSIPEPSVLVLLSTALAALFLKSLRRATA
jgi:hypothetical protein